LIADFVKCKRVVKKAGLEGYGLRIRKTRQVGKAGKVKRERENAGMRDRQFK